MLHYVLSTMLGKDWQKNEIPDPYPQRAWRLVKALGNINGTHYLTQSGRSQEGILEDSNLSEPWRVSFSKGGLREMGV